MTKPRRSSGAMRHAAPAGKRTLDDAAKATPWDLTGAPLAAKPGAAEEYARFAAIKQRSLCLPETELADRLRGATVLVTGGTGCIGSALMAQLAARAPGRLFSVSRGITVAWPRQESATAAARLPRRPARRVPQFAIRDLDWPARGFT